MKAQSFFEDTDIIIIVQELMITDLRELLVKLDEPLSEGKIKNLFSQMLKSVEYCHCQNVVHRDIKLENFLVNVTPDN